MAAKSSKTTKTDEELLAELDQLGTDVKPASKPTTSKHKSKKSAGPSQEEQDLLAELDKLDTLAQARPSSRPETPRASANAPASRNSAEATSRTSEDKAGNPVRKSQESVRAFHQGLTPGDSVVDSTSAADVDRKVESGGSWWGGLVATASAAVTQAQAIAKDLQQREEAQKWAEQVKGNVGVLRNYGGELRSMALPTFSNILNTLAPPISSHERLMIHITHDFIGYPSLDPLIYQTFSRVMAQVEGGELMVIQKKQESKQRKASDAAYRGSNIAGWNDGPWWRQSNEHRDFGTISGLVEGTKLCRVSAESYASEYFNASGGIEAATKAATESLSESNPTRSSDIFLAIQAIHHTTAQDLFAGQTKSEEKPNIADPSTSDELVCFALYLYDPVHAITFSTVSQNIPQKWIEWVNQTASTDESGVPEDIREIIGEGGMDPREWVSEWIEETIALSVGILAQRYVAKRMGVGEGGLGRGKARDAAVEAGAGEAARAQ